ncbi:MAG: exostosin family protein [Ramlibacter sp.]|nr:exostosin family protein [Ramlibacter sp.]
MKLYFELDEGDPHYKAAWENRIAAWSRISSHHIVTSPEAADLIVLTIPQLGGNRWWLPHRTRGSLAHRFHAKAFAWDCSDHPLGFAPGLYCSLPKRGFDAMRHRAFSYALTYNSEVGRFPPATAHQLFGLTGQVSSPLRERIFQNLAPSSRSGEALLRQTDNSHWSSLFAGTPDEARRQYARDLAAVKFVLCPRGTGTSSVRLFETMQAGRVPVILSDRWVAPAMVDWHSCAIRIAERDLMRLPAILREREPDWLAMAQSARREWEAHFSDDRFLETLVTELQTLQELSSPARLWSVPRYLTRATPMKARGALVRVRQSAQRSLQRFKG